MNATKYAVAGLVALLLAALRCNGQGDTLAHGQPPRDLWRIVDGVTYCICGPGFKDYYFTKNPEQWNMHGNKKILPDGWFMAAGKVIEVQPFGIRVRGLCSYFFRKERSDGSTIYYITSYPRSIRGDAGEPDEMIFFIANYPYPVADNDNVAFCAVKEAGIYTYNTVTGGSASIHKFDYGSVTSQPVAPLPTAEELQAAKAAAEIKKAEGKAKALKYDKEMADKGDSYSQRRMGERFRDGDGVEKSLSMARNWLALAAGQGDKKAARELNELPSK